MKMNIDEALKWIAEIFEEPEENITTETKRDDIELWDSLGTLTLMAQLDETFDIILSEEELTGLASIEDILQVLKDNEKLES